MRLRVMQTLVVSVALMVPLGPLAFGMTQGAAAAQNSNSAKGQMKEGGSEMGKAGTSLGHNVRHGRVVRGGKEFGQHVGRGAKHAGKGTVIVAKKGGHKVKRAIKH